MTKRPSRTATPHKPTKADDLGVLSKAWNVEPRYFSLRITYIAKLIERETARALTDSFGISVAEWRVIAQLARSGPMTVRELAEQAWADRAEVSRAAASLITRGYVVRKVVAHDRRSPLFSCTPRGRALHRRIVPMRDAFQRALTDQIHPISEDDFQDALYRLARWLMQNGTHAKSR